jgi:hypothetical protein
MNLNALRALFDDYHVVLEPDRDVPEWWAGAPSVCRDANGAFWMACRMREGDSPRGLRGYEIRILRSENGTSFEHVHSIPREQVPIPGFERPAILCSRDTGSFSLFGCGPWDGGPWSILRFDDASDPTRFVPSTCRPVIQPAPPPEDPRANHVTGFKDPFIFVSGGVWHCLTIGVFRAERTYHLTSPDGWNWAMTSPDPVFDLGGWHSFCTRPAAVLPMAIGHLMVYEGANPAWYDPVYNIATGLAWTADFASFTDLTPDGPILTSTTPGAYMTWRYSHWMWADGALFVYAEVARPNATNEIRAWRLPLQF